MTPRQHLIAPTQALTPAIGYVRVSTWREEMISVDIQKNVVEDAAARRGRYISEWIIDPDNTGRNFKRKVMRAIEIIEDSARPERELWSWKFSRFGRNRHGVAINLARIESVGGELVSATEDVDSKTAVGRFTRGMLLEVAAFESDRAGEQWKETHQLRRNLGLPATGGKRFGYIWHPRRLPDGAGGWTIQEERYEALPPQAEVAVEGYQDYIRGTIAGFGKIAVRWNELGFRNPRGTAWQDQTVKWYMDSGFAAGLLRVHKPDLPCPTRSNCSRPGHHHYLPAEHESLVTGEEWDAYQDRRQTRRQTPSRALAPVYPLAGLIKCGPCRRDGRISAGSIHAAKGDVGYGYRCGARARHHVQHEPVYIRRRIVEGAVFDWLRGVAAEIDGISAGLVVLPRPRKTPDVDKRRTRLEAAVSKATKALDRATEAFSQGDIPRDSYLRTRDKFTRQRDEAREELASLPEKEEAPPSPLPYREVIEGLIQEWGTISVPSKRVTLSTVVRRVEIFPEDVVQVVPVWAPADPPMASRESAARRAL